MSRSRLASIGIVAITFLLSGCANVSAAGPGEGSLQTARSAAPTPPQQPIAGEAAEPDNAGIQVTLTTRHWTESWDERDPDRPRFDLPLLYLHRQREATPEAERTLDIEITGFPPKTVLQIEIVSRHADSSTFKRHTETNHFVTPDRACTPDGPCAFHWTFDPGAVPSDFYDLRVNDAAGNLVWENATSDRPDFVMLDTWDVDVGTTIVRIYYATLFPFARGQHDLGNRLPPSQVADFIESQFVPTILDTWFTQLNAWGFGESIHPDWDPDNVVEIIVTDPPFALFGGTGTYTVMVDQDGRPYPHRRIWWFSTNNAFRPYDSLAEAYKAVFAHEFFHLVQWNVLLSAGQASAGQASAGCSTDKWLNLFIEAQGKFAPSVQVPEIEINRSSVVNVESEYMGAANHFLKKRLNSSYRDIEADVKFKYDAALYWRFLYEQYGSLAIIRAALEEMACGYDADIVQGIGDVMDRAFRRLDGPFQTFEESLMAFARANYALRLENGRCGDADFAACGGRYYDPQIKYVAPPLEVELIYDGAPLTYAGAVPTSFGMDFIELGLDPAVQGQPLTVRFQGEGEVARFSVQVWRLGSRDPKPRALTPRPETVPPGSGDAYTYAMTQLDTTGTERLALIIVRLDRAESIDPAGKYSITLDSSKEYTSGGTQKRKDPWGFRNPKGLGSLKNLHLVQLPVRRGHRSRTTATLQP